MYRIGSWQFEAEAATLRQGGVVKLLEDRSARVLEVLCRRRGEVVSKEELLDEVWQGRSVSANSVAIVIGDLRRILGDSANEPVHIITVGKRGYRLAGAPHVEPDTPGRIRRWMPMLACALILALAAVAVSESPGRRASPVDLVVMPTTNETGQVSYDDLARSLAAVVTDRSARFRGVRVRLPDSAPAQGRRLLLNSRLIRWNGAPELAVTATDPSGHTILWSAFATGASGNLARDTATKLDSLQLLLDQAVEITR